MPKRTWSLPEIMSLIRTCRGFDERPSEIGRDIWNKNISIRKRFQKYVLRSEETDCWIWIGATGRWGYGLLMLNRKYGQRAHRLSYELYRGTIPDRMHVLHTCDNPPCVNPEHLFIGDNHDNMMDRDAKRHQQFGEKNTHAKLTEETILEIRKQNMSSRDISNRYGVTMSQAWRIKRGIHWKHTIPPKYPFQHGNAKLNEEDVRRILNDNRSLSKIGKDYSVSPSTISMIRNKIIWKHITPHTSSEVD